MSRDLFAEAPPLRPTGVRKSCIQCCGPRGHRYLLDPDAVENRWASDRDDVIYVKMSRGSTAILIVSTLAEFDAALAACREANARAANE